MFPQIERVSRKPATHHEGIDLCAFGTHRLKDLAGIAVRHASQSGGITGKKEPKKSQVPVTFGKTTVKPGDIIFADIDGVVAIPREHLIAVADQADHLGADEAAARNRILAGEELQAVWPV
ncbi:RraA family protein [Pseudooceanicola spongiae]|uniref:Uncharacterized protein n=1 Tax=Pseudooceanicola spongiae TaxID=2613965 RepID=A0A7M3V2Q3_9RHOB|nr:hypothetical protein [Pseudooceanicola spongiae]QOL79366.1 hypothetical protein F3W81_00060 [Pseudooceanicola spongiae]